MKTYTLTEIELVLLEWIIHCNESTRTVVDAQLDYQQQMEEFNVKSFTREQLTNALVSLEEATYKVQGDDEF